MSLDRQSRCGDGVRVRATVNGVTTIYVGNHYEVKGGTVKKYYYANGVRIAARSGGNLYYLHLDHLGSTMLTTDTGDPPDRAAEQRFYPWGQATRYTYGTQKTEYNFTGQRLDDSTDLLYYGARYYDPALRRWVQPDTLVPDPGNPQALNRYSYVLNNPVLYVDPAGHAACIDADCNLLQNPTNNNIMVRAVDGSGLYALIARASVGTASAAERLEQILADTAGTGLAPLSWLNGLDEWVGGGLHTHFRGLGGVRGDKGFALEFQDDYLYPMWEERRPASKQVGHFLTAVSMGYSGEDVWIHLIVGHEQAADTPTGLFRQVLPPRPNSQDKAAFRAAVAMDAAGDIRMRDALLYSILDPVSLGTLAARKGNSMADLRLSVRGWRLGQTVASGGMQTNRELSNWIALNVAGD